MLDGWYCRTLANEQQATQNDEPTDPNVEINDDESGSDDSREQNTAMGNSNVDYKTQYRYLKRKLKFLIYENEFFEDALRSNQRRLLKVSRDRAFLLDRLLQYEKPENTSSESDETDLSDDEQAKETKKRKLEQNTNGTNGGAPRGRKKKVAAVVVAPPQTENSTTAALPPAIVAQPPTMEKPPLREFNAVLEEQQQGHMTAAEVERHLQSRQPVMQLMPERAPATVPTEMFSNEPSLDSESNDHMIEGSSPTHVAAEECVPMEYLE